MHSRSAGAGNLDRTANLLGALALEVTRAQEQATQAVVGQAGAAAAALVVIAAAPGRTIEHLRGPLGLTQPGAARLVERLATAGWVDRGGPGGRRGLSLTLTPEGQAVLDDLLAARRAALEAVLTPLEAAEREQLTGLLETLLAARVHDRPDCERLCRLCERPVCARCPVGRALDRHLMARSAGPRPAP
jgi:DNA-binding MarR family transcriptional regulator